MIAVLVIVSMLVVSQVVTYVWISGLREGQREMWIDVDRRIRYNHVAGRTAELERDLNMDLDGLPPFWRTVVRLRRAWDR